MTKCVALVLMMLLAGCTQPTKDFAEEISTAPLETAEEETTTETHPDTRSEVTQSVSVEETDDTCASELEPHNIKQIKTTLFETGLQKTEEGFSFRVLPMDETGTVVIPTEGMITIGVYSSMPDDPLKREFSLYKQSFHVKEEDVLPDCGPLEVTVLWDTIKSHKNYRYVELPNHGIVEIQFTRTGSSQLFETEYRAAEFDEYILS